MKEGNGEKPEQVSVLPSSAFTDLEDPESRERFKALMKFQYGFSDERLERSVEMLRRQERWKAEANFYLAEITDSEHEYFGRIGQVMWAMGGSFVDNKPLYKFAANELQPEMTVEYKLCLVIKIDLELVQFPEDGGQYQLLNKNDIAAEEIEVEDENGRVGVLLGWQKNDREGLPFGFYTARFGEEITEKGDWLMMQEPTWEFRRRGAKHEGKS
jgi:hypothetical protein